jgi:CheY-like chemotaxis protein
MAIEVLNACCGLKFFHQSRSETYQYPLPAFSVGGMNSRRWPMATVLILEDDVSNMECFTALLWSSGYKVLEATTGSEAIEIGKDHGESIDLFLSDVAVPERSGTEVALELSRSHPSLAVLFISGTPLFGWEATDVNNFKRLPHDRVDVLEKPFLPRVLLSKIALLLEKVVHSLPRLKGRG